MCPSSDFKWRNIEVQKCHIFCSKLLRKIFLVNIFAGTVMSLDCSWLTVKKASIQLYIQLLPGIVFKLISKFLSTSDVNANGLSQIEKKSGPLTYFADQNQNPTFFGFFKLETWYFLPKNTNFVPKILLFHKQHFFLYRNNLQPPFVFNIFF